MKILEVTMSSDGSVWHIPAEAIAEDRARYYARKDADTGEGDYEDLFRSEREMALNDASELVDWAANNMDWADVKDVATLIRTPSPAPDYKANWTNAKMVVREAA